MFHQPRIERTASPAARRAASAVGAVWLVLAGAMTAGIFAKADGQEMVAASQPRLEVAGWTSMMDLGRLSYTAGTISRSESFCVASNTGSFILTLDSAFYSGNSFALSSGAWTTMPYHVSFAPNLSDYREMQPGTGAVFSTSLDKCKNQTPDNVSIRIDILANDFNNAESGFYADYLTAIFSAQ